MPPSRVITFNNCIGASVDVMYMIVVLDKIANICTHSCYLHRNGVIALPNAPRPTSSVVALPCSRKKYVFT